MLSESKSFYLITVKKMEMVITEMAVESKITFVTKASSSLNF